MWAYRPLVAGLRIFARQPLALSGNIINARRQFFSRRRTIAPPELPREKEFVVAHGRQLSDPYAWVFDPSNEERVRAHLAAENEYTIANLRKNSYRFQRTTKELQHIAKSLPSPPLLAFDYKGFHYYEMEGKKGLPIFMRKEILLNTKTGEVSTGTPQTVLDLNDAVSHSGGEILAAGFLAISPCTRFAVILSRTDDSRTAAVVSSMKSDGQAGQVVGILNDVLQADWAGNGRLAFVKDAEGKRPRRVLYKYIPDCPSNWRENDETVLYEEKDPRFHLEIRRTRDDRYMTINSNARTTSEVSLLDLLAEELSPKCLWPREEDVEYYVDHMGEHFYAMVSEKPCGELQFIQASDAAAFAGKENWSVFANHEISGEHLTDFTLMAEHCMLHTRVENQPRFRVLALSDPRKQNAIEFENSVCEVKLISNNDIHSPTFHLIATGPTEYPFDVTVNLVTGKVSQEKQKFAIVPDASTVFFRTALMFPFISDVDRWDYDPSRYALSRVTVKSADKVDVPITIVLRPDREVPLNRRPMLALVYGAYGENIEMSFRPEFLWFVEHGWLLAFCHVRGGGELGRKWYTGGHRALKEKTFEDLQACIEGLHANSYSCPTLTALYGFSAGALPVAVLAQRHPTLFQAGVLRSPFVDILEVLRGPDLQAAADRDEFGEVIQDRRAFNRILSYCPYQTISARSYPDLLVTCAEEDVLCSAKSAARYVGQLRAKKLAWDVDDGEEESSLFLKIREGSEHNTINSDDWPEEIAVELEFLLKSLAL